MPKKINSLMEKTQEEISKLSRDVHDKKVIDHHLEYLRDLSKRNIPTKIIHEVLNNTEILAEVASRSYEHVNHFDKIVLVDNPDPLGFRFTLHAWNCNYGDEIPDEELIHNHRFSFWSHLLRGNMEAETFSEAKKFSVEKKTFNKYVYRPSATGNIHDCTFAEKSQLNKNEDVQFQQGETYYLKYDTIHRIHLPRSGSNLCTCVLRGPREREFTNTYNTFYPDRGIASNVPMMAPDQLKSKLIKILEETK